MRMNIKPIDRVWTALLPISLVGQLLCAFMARARVDADVVPLVVQSWQQEAQFSFRPSDSMSWTLVGYMGKQAMVGILLFFLGAVACIGLAVSLRRWWMTLTATLYSGLAVGISVPFALGYCGHVFTKLLLVSVPYFLLYSACGIVLWVVLAALTAVGTVGGGRTERTR